MIIIRCFKHQIRFYNYEQMQKTRDKWYQCWRKITGSTCTANDIVSIISMICKKKKLLHLHPMWLQNYIRETEFCIQGQSWCAWCWNRTGTHSVQQGGHVSSLWIGSAENSMSIHKLIHVLHYSCCVVSYDSKKALLGLFIYEIINSHWYITHIVTQFCCHNPVYHIWMPFAQNKQGIVTLLFSTVEPTPFVAARQIKASSEQ